MTKDELEGLKAELADLEKRYEGLGQVDELRRFALKTPRTKTQRKSDEAVRALMLSRILELRKEIASAT